MDKVVFGVNGRKVTQWARHESTYEFLRFLCSTIIRNRHMSKYFLCVSALPFVFVAVGGSLENIKFG